MKVDQLDYQRLNDYLTTAAPHVGQIQTYEKFSGGQSNPTFLLKTSTGQFVLRRQPPGKLLKSAHAVDREFRVMQALQNTQVPVPRMEHLCTEPDVLGGMFFVMEFMPGRIYWKAALPEIDTPAVRSTMYDAMNHTLASLHSVDIEQAGLQDYGKPGNYFARQTERWTQQYRASETQHNSAMESLMDYLTQNMPADDGQVALVHGDFRLDNMMFNPSASPDTVIAVLDWELSTLGHPFADLAYQCMQLRLPASLPQAPGLGGIDRSSLGIPSEQEYILHYCQRRGIAGIDNWAFYLAFSFFRLAAILQGVVKRGLDGNASSDKAGAMGAMVGPLADMAMQVVRQEEQV